MKTYKQFIEAYGDVNPSVDGNPIMLGGKPMSMNSKEFKWTQKMSDLKRNNPSKYKEVKSLMGPHGWKTAPAGMKIPSGI